MKYILIIIFILNSSFLFAQNHGDVKSNFVNNINGYMNIDSFYTIETKSAIIRYLDKFLPYPSTAYKNCISENIKIGFTIHDIYGAAIMDSSSIHIIEGINKDLAVASIKTFKSILQWPHPNNKGRFPQARNIDVPLVISFAFKMIDCNESPFKIANTPKNGYYSEYYKINNKIKLEGFFKNGFADSSWVFYDTSGVVKCRGFFKECFPGKNNGEKKYVLAREEGEIKGTKQGTWEYYDSQGKIITRKQFNCDQLVSSADFVLDKNK